MSDPALNYQLKEIARALGYLVHEFKRFNDNVEAQQVAAITAIRKQKEEEPTSTT